LRLGLGQILPIFGRLVPILWIVMPAFDRIVPSFVSFFLNRTLGGWKSKGLIDDYGTRTVRSGRLSYKVEICVVLTSEQAGDKVRELLARAIG
jgi:hypothetical protein